MSPVFRDRLRPGERLNRDKLMASEFQSRNGKFRVGLTIDDRLALRFNGFRLLFDRLIPKYIPSYCSDCELLMTKSGNLVVLDKQIWGTSLWESKTKGDDNFAILQDDGILAIYGSNKTKLWSAGYLISRFLLLLNMQLSLLDKIKVVYRFFEI